MKTKKIGQIGVDAGMVMIGDPCYHLHAEERYRSPKFGTSWNGFCASLGDGLSSQIGKLLAVVVQAGFGDGLYDVYADIEDYGDLGERIKAVHVIFIED